MISARFNWGNNSSCNDLSIAIKGDSKIGRIALFVHYTDKPGLMLHTHDRFLKLSVNNNSVGHDDNIIENDLIVSIVECSKAIRKPSDRIGLAGACTVLNKIVERGAVFLYIGKELADGIELMITGKDNALLDLDLACLFVPFLRGLKRRDELEPVYKEYRGKSGCAQSRFKKKNAATIEDYEATVKYIKEHIKRYAVDGKPPTMLDLLKKSNKLKSKWNRLNIEHTAFLTKRETAKKYVRQVRQYINEQQMKREREKYRQKKLTQQRKKNTLE